MICIHCPIFHCIFHHDLLYMVHFISSFVFVIVLTFSLCFILSTFHSCRSYVDTYPPPRNQFDLLCLKRTTPDYTRPVFAWLFQCTYYCPIVYFLQLLIVSLNVSSFKYLSGKNRITSGLGLDDMSLAWPAVVQLLVLTYSGTQQNRHEYSSLFIIVIYLIFMFLL